VDASVFGEWKPSLDEFADGAPNFGRRDYVNAGKAAEFRDFAACAAERAGTGEYRVVSGRKPHSDAFDFHLRGFFNVTHEFARFLSAQKSAAMLRPYKAR
jgi:hypothetical protein